MISRKYKAVLFDMDGVIADSMEHHAESWQTVFREYGVLISKEEIFKREGMSGLDSIIDVIRSKGVPVPDEKEQKKLQKRKLELFEKNRIEIFPHVLDILQFLKSKNVGLGLVTGSLKRSVNFILPREIFQFFDAVVTFDDITSGKPHPEPYLKALVMTGCGPEDALVIENAPLGIESAKSAGIDCFALETTLPSEYLDKADRIFKTHEALFEFLKIMLN